MCLVIYTQSIVGWRVETVFSHYFHGVVPLLELGGEVRWEEARELAGPLRLEAAARLPLPPPALVLARELGGSSVETGREHKS